MIISKVIQSKKELKMRIIIKNNNIQNNVKEKRNSTKEEIKIKSP